MNTIALDIETDDIVVGDETWAMEGEMSFEVTPGEAAQLYGPPENCYPGTATVADFLHLDVTVKPTRRVRRNDPESETEGSPFRLETDNEHLVFAMFNRESKEEEAVLQYEERE